MDERMTPQQFAAIRLMLDITQAELGEKLGNVSTRQIRRYEKGHTKVPPLVADRMRELAKVAAARKARSE